MSGGRAKLYSFTCGPRCPLKKAWNAPQKLSPVGTSFVESQAVDEATMQDVVKRLYTPLALDQIRLLVIHPDSPEAPIRTKLVLATFTRYDRARVDEHPSRYVSYAALSYSWGDADFTSSIECNGIDFPVTPHLKNALRHIRKQDNDIYIWTDAFCINQYDLEEKGEQVQLMFYIYKRAERTICWLGEPDRSNYQLLAAMALGINGLASAHEALVMPDRQCQAIFEQISKKLLAFIDGNRWFRRTWIRQEVFAAQRLDMACGMYHFKFDMLVHLSFREPTRSLVHRSFRTLLGDARRSALPGDLSNAWSSNWWDLVLINSSGFEASNLHDRIYALQNIAEPDYLPEDRLIRTTDYTRTWAETWAVFIRSLILHYENINYLVVFEDRTNPTHLRTGLPTWVPDLENDQSRLIPRIDPLEKYYLEDHIWQRLAARINSDDDWATLRLIGRRVGTVVSKCRSSKLDGLEIDQALPMTSFGLQGSDGRKAGRATHSLYTITDLQNILRQVNSSCFEIKTDSDVSDGLAMERYEGPHADFDSLYLDHILASSAVHPGDIVVAFPQGSRTFTYLFIVRPFGVKDSFHRFLGPCIPITRRKLAVRVNGPGDSDSNMSVDNDDDDDDDANEPKEEDLLLIDGPDRHWRKLYDSPVVSLRAHDAFGFLHGTERQQWQEYCLV